TFLKRTDLNQDAASRMGIGAQIANNSAAIVALLSIQKAELKPFPRSLAKPRSHELCGKLLLPLQAPKVFVTQPNGQVERVAPAPGGPGRLLGGDWFPRRGPFVGGGHGAGGGRPGGGELVPGGGGPPRLARGVDADVGAEDTRRSQASDPGANQLASLGRS